MFFFRSFWFAGTKVTLVNFVVKEQGLEAQLLGIVVGLEEPQLEEQGRQV